MRELFSYQVNAIQRMEEVESIGGCAVNVCNDGIDLSFTSTCGFLADPTGSGKTCTMLNFIKGRHKKLCQDNQPVVMTCGYNTFIKEHVTMHPMQCRIFSDCTVVIVSPNITAQWVNEAKQDDITYKVVNTNLQMQKFFDHITDDVQVVIVNENRYKLFCMTSAFREISFARCVYDECRHMKASSTQALLNVRFTWFMSASRSDTPEADDFFNGSNGFLMYSGITPGYIFEHIAVRTPLSEIKYPGKLVYVHYNCQKTMSQVTDIIIDELDPDLRQRLSAGDVAGALQVLGAEEASDIFSVVVHRLNRDIRHVEFLVSEITNDSLHGMRSSAASQRLARLEDQKAGLLRQLDSAQSRFDDMLSNGTCSICLESFTDPTMISCCSNVYCAMCIVNAQVASKKCPMCRSSHFKLHRVVQNGNVNPKHYEPSDQPITKVDVLKKILQKTSALKVLVYSEWDSIMPLLSELCVEFDCELLHLQGFTSTRTRMLGVYNAKGTRVLMFASGLTDCSGLDLPSTTDIVLWHRMDAQKTHQIVGRCQRMSTERDHRCTIHHLHPA